MQIVLETMFKTIEEILCGPAPSAKAHPTICNAKIGKAKKTVSSANPPCGMYRMKTFRKYRINCNPAHAIEATRNSWFATVVRAIAASQLSGILGTTTGSKVFVAGE